MIIESEHQYQEALRRIEFIINGGEPVEGSASYNELQDLVSEVKIYENKYHKEGVEEPTFEFWSAKEGINPESTDPEDYKIIKVKENELTREQIELLAGEFLKSFDKLPAASKRIVRLKLRY